MKIIRHGKGTVGRVVKVGDPIKFANNLIVTPPPVPLAQQKGRKRVTK